MVFGLISGYCSVVFVPVLLIWYRCSPPRARCLKNENWWRQIAHQQKIFRIPNQTRIKKLIWTSGRMVCIILVWYKVQSTVCIIHPLDHHNVILRPHHRSQHDIVHSTTNEFRDDPIDLMNFLVSDIYVGHLPALGETTVFSCVPVHEHILHRKRKS